MNRVLDILTRGDPCALLMLIGILLMIGAKITDEFHQRLGVWFSVIAFIAYGVYGCIAFDPRRAEDLLGIAWRGVLTGGLVLGLSWILLPILAFLLRRTLVVPWQRLRAWSEAAKKRAAGQWTRCKEEERLRQERAEYAQSAPEREQAQREAEERARADAEAKRRRGEARLSCEILFSSLQPDISPRFSREMFDDFLKRHMGDEDPPEQVEERARQLQQVLQRHLEAIKPPPVETDIAEEFAAYNREVEKIRALGLDPTWEQALLGQAKKNLYARIKKREAP